MQLNAHVVDPGAGALRALQASHRSCGLAASIGLAIWARSRYFLARGWLTPGEELL